MARHATAREIKQRIADRKPKPDVKTSVRRSLTPRLVAESDSEESDAAKQGEPAVEASAAQPRSSLAAANFSGSLPLVSTAEAPTFGGSNRHVNVTCTLSSAFYV